MTCATLIFSKDMQFSFRTIEAKQPLGEKFFNREVATKQKPNPTKISGPFSYEHDYLRCLKYSEPSPDCDGTGGGSTDGGSAQTSVINTFLASNEYQSIRNSGILTGYSSYDREKSKVQFYDEDTTKPWINLWFYNGPTTAILKVAKVAESKVPIVSKRYVTVLTKFYNNFQFANYTGQFEMFDTDANNIRSGLFVVSNRVLISKPPDAGGGRHLCDYNGNGNITFFECMKCFVQSCRNLMHALCGYYIYYCMGSMIISCGIISAIY
jgi:hypothetical protein